MDTNVKETHRIEMISRNDLKVYGVIDVHSFNDEGVLLETNQGILLVGGKDLRITKLNLDQYEVAIKGEIDNLNYTDNTPIGSKGNNFFTKLLK